MIQLAIKRLFKFLPHPAYVFALPGEVKTHEISVKMNKKRQKPSVTLLIVTLEKDSKILIFFGINVSDITGLQIAIQILWLAMASWLAAK